ncbi:MAG TPA: hypothetical protein VFW33_02100 [Gemmataceae bacterium]|nr:hypothetical protein [Gemmataceae bacterium]
MLRDGGKPLVGTENNMLGVRVPPHPRADVAVNPDGTVSPATGKGLSVAPSLEALAKVPFLVSRRLRRRFPAARGVDDLVTWKLGEGAFTAGPVAPGLTLCPDGLANPRHGVVETDTRVPVNNYQQALAATRETWEEGET